MQRKTFIVIFAAVIALILFVFISSNDSDNVTPGSFETVVEQQLQTYDDAELEKIRHEANRKIVLYFEYSDASLFDIETFAKELSTLHGVESATYISPEEELLRFKELNKQNTYAMQALEEEDSNPFDPSIEIFLDDLSQKQNIVDYIESSDIDAFVSTSNI